jgi:LysM repeat protein
VPDQIDDQTRLGAPAARPRGRRRHSALRTALTWMLAAAIVLTLAATAGLLTAYFVASMRAVPTPAQIGGLDTPRPTAVASAAPQVSPSAPTTAQPRFTPTPSPTITPEPSPIIHVVVRHETLSSIASLYCTTVDAILAVNDIPNPNRIAVGAQLVIPPDAGCPSPST